MRVGAGGQGLDPQVATAGAVRVEAGLQHGVDLVQRLGRSRYMWPLMVAVSASACTRPSRRGIVVRAGSFLGPIRRWLWQGELQQVR
ncbi:MAG: hypothetical protein JO345_03405 [Streptosporangiaceae bacterium]|nr:hypothetical protein [Streptosporangiaceae bacterium]